jgi:hypothetical protein
VSILVEYMPRKKYHMFYVLYPFVTSLPTLPRRSFIIHYSSVILSFDAVWPVY